MEVLKLKLFQKTACYKKPFAFKVGETYPLPPYSTVKGMLHNVLGAEEFIPMGISIQGSYESQFSDYQSMYFHKPNEVTQMPINMHLLLNVNLIIHVRAEKQILDEIINGFKNLDEHLYLGRREDLIRIDGIRRTKVSEYDPREVGEPFRIKNPIYIPNESIEEDLKGINYRLNWKYEIINGLRQWVKKIDVKYVEKGESITGQVLKVDDENDMVCFNV